MRGRCDWGRGTGGCGHAPGGGTRKGPAHGKESQKEEGVGGWGLTLLPVGGKDWRMARMMTGGVVGCVVVGCPQEHASNEALPHNRPVQQFV